jgi:hypothetical protein
MMSILPIIFLKSYVVFMKTWNILRKNLRWCLIMLVCYLVQGLIPPNVIANHDLKFLATLLLPRRSMMVLKNQLQVLWIQFNMLIGPKKNK